MGRFFLILACTLLLATPVRAQSDAPYELSFEEARMAQAKLYGLLYKISIVDGKIGPETRTAISRWQAHHGQPVTGYLTKQQYEYLAGVDFGTFMYASVAASTDGAYAAVWSRKQRLYAEREALAACRNRSKSPEKCIVVNSATASDETEHWIAALHCKRGDDDDRLFHISVASARTREAAITEVRNMSAEDGYVRSQCELRTIVESRGRHQ